MELEKYVDQQMIVDNILLYTPVTIGKACDFPLLIQVGPVSIDNRLYRLDDNNIILQIKANIFNGLVLPDISHAGQEATVTLREVYPDTPTLTFTPGEERTILTTSNLMDKRWMPQELAVAIYSACMRWGEHQTRPFTLAPLALPTMFNTEKFFQTV